MQKGCLIAIGVLVIIVIGLLIGAKWLLTEAFGPKYRDVEIPISADKKIIGKETYNADFAAVFYDVDLSLIKEIDTINLGRTTFKREDWDENIEILEMDEWTLLLIKDNTYFQLLGINKKKDQKIDTTFSPLELRHDSLWKKQKLEIPAYLYAGNSKVDSVKENSFYITFSYRLGLSEPFEFYDQRILYTMNKNTGVFKTTKVFERIKRK